jgi:phage gp36-like protein
MPTYADQTDLDNFFSQANITDWADKDRDGQLDSDELLAIDAALEAAEGIVDGYLARAGYAAPFDGDRFSVLSTRVKALLKQWTVAIAGFHIYAWRGLRDRTNALERLYGQMLKQLRSLGQGLSLADMPRNAQVSSGSGRSNTEPTDRLDSLRSDGWDW